ncbi:MAG: hypothetical protein M1419_06350 [Bacteroidetes bacterium]|nr:hypothetical protein [Bacteroidota bacterium]
MKILYSILFVLPLILLGGCCIDGEHDAFYEFNSDEKDWQIYKANDTMKFVNQSGEMRYYIIESVVRDTTPSFEKFSFGCDNNHNLNISVYAQKLPKTDTTFLLLSMSKYSNQFNLNIYWEGLGEYYMSNQTNIPLFIDGIRYSDIYIVSNHDISPSDKYYQWFYSKSRGMRRMDAVNGDVWIRKN